MKHKKGIEAPTDFSKTDVENMKEALRVTGKTARDERQTQKNLAKKLGLTLVESVRPFHIRPRRTNIPARPPDNT